MLFGYNAKKMDSVILYLILSFNKKHIQTYLGPQLPNIASIKVTIEKNKNINVRSLL